MNMRSLLAIFIFCFSFSFTSLADEADDVADEMAKVLTEILQKAIDSKELFLHDINRQKKSNFYDFRFNLPTWIANNRDNFDAFIKAMRRTIAKEHITGPNLRPLTLHPSAPKVIRRTASRVPTLQHPDLRPGLNRRRFEF